jgi:hypothetical protein
MNPTEHLRPEFVQFIPEQLEPGVLYVSKRYSTASHLCCCGCGLEVVTPLNPAKWRIDVYAGTVSMWPSVGNWSFPCQSHYIIKKSAVIWAGAMSAAEIAAVQSRDRRDAVALAPRGSSMIVAIRRGIVDAWNRLVEWLGK